MEYDQDKVDEMTLALLYLASTRVEGGLGARAWKGLNSQTLDRLHAKGWIEQPNRKDISLYVTEEGYLQSERLFRQHFAKSDDS